MGISGVLSCFDAADGSLLWQRNFEREFGTSAPEYGAAASPLIEQDLLIVPVGGRDRGAVRAFDYRSGDLRWSWDEDGPAYASPIAATLAGQRQIVIFTQRFLVSLELLEGRELWRIPFTTPYEQNAVTPLVVNDLVIYSGLEQSTSAIRVVDGQSGLATELFWQNPAIWMYLSSPIRVESMILGMSSQEKGKLFSLDLQDGQLLWETPGRLAENAALLNAGGLTWVLTNNAELIAGRPDRAGFNEVARFDVSESATWAHPVFAGQTILIKDRLHLLRYNF